ncbi:unnamed protein product, partial [Rhizoctonia solani]
FHAKGAQEIRRWTQSGRGVGQSPISCAPLFHAQLELSRLLVIYHESLSHHQLSSAAMSDTSFSPTWVVASVGILSVYLVVRKLRSDRLPLPPGPPSYPVIGQLLSMPRSMEGPAFMDMSVKLNSDILSYSFFGKTIIVLNSNEAAYDLLEKRSSIHSGRFCPPMIASPNLMNMKDFLVFMDTNELWRKQRRAISSRLGKHALIQR